MRESFLTRRLSVGAMAWGFASLRTLVLLSLLVSLPALALDLKEDDLLLLDVVMERQVLASAVTAYAVHDKTDTAVVSLAEFGSALEFPIVVDAGKGTASGWFIRPERLFKLDIKEGYVEIGGKRIPLAKGEAIVHQGAIFVPIEALVRWFPLDLTLQTSTLSLDVKPRERLPMQDRAARRAAAKQEGGVGAATQPLIATPYRRFGPQAADIGLNYSISHPVNGAPTVRGGSYSALVSGDLAYMDSHLYLNGDQTDKLSNAQWNLSKDKLGLPMGLRYVELGDIVPVIVQGLSSNGVERGVLIQGGGSAIGRDDLINSDSVNLSGNALPGWDVELFQNGMHIGYQTIGSDGRYNFTNIDPAFGENKFELVFYGPAGERRTETLVRNSGLGLDQPGSVRYQFSASQQGEQLYKGASTRTTSDLGGARLAAGLQVRVLPRLSLNGAWNNVTVNGQRINYTSLGAATSWRDFSLSANANHDPINGTTWGGSLQLPAKTNLLGFDTRFSHTQYVQSVQLDTAQNTLSPTTTTTSSQVLQLTSRTGVTLTGPIGPTKTVFSLFHNHEVGSASNSASAGFTARTGKLTFGNNLNYYRFSNESGTTTIPDQFAGNAFFSTSAIPMSLRGGVSYTLKPQSKALQYFLNSNLTVARDMSMDFGLTYTPLSKITEYSSGFNWQLPLVTLSPRVTYDSNGTYSGFVYASFSLAARPDRAGVLMTGSSLAAGDTVAARVYLDNDASGSYTPGDTPLPNVMVRAPQAFRSATTDDQGVAYLTGLSSPHATDVVLDEGTLPSTQMASKNPGKSVLPRPTATAVIDFPVIPMGEIEGHVFSMQQGKRMPLAGAMVELRDATDKVVAFKSSGHDGYFLFEAVPYASYRLNLGGKQREQANQPSLILNRDHADYSRVDLVLGAPDVESAPVSVPVSTSVPAPVVPPVKPAPQPPAPKHAPSGGRLVQLGAFASMDAAQAYRQKLQGLALMQGARVDIVTVDLGKFGYFHRVVATPVETSAAALCASLKAHGTECFTIAP